MNEDFYPMSNKGYGSVSLSICGDFQARPAKFDTINTVKLNQGNLQTIGNKLLSQGFTVTINEAATATLPNVQVGTDVYQVGQWLVQEYDYETEKNTYRLATLEDRQKYDLR